LPNTFSGYQNNRTEGGDLAFQCAREERYIIINSRVHVMSVDSLSIYIYHVIGQCSMFCTICTGHVVPAGLVELYLPCGGWGCKGGTIE